MADLHEQQQHILVATFPGQGHINPALHLANRLAHFPTTHVTFSTTISGHRRMFPSSSSSELQHNLVTYSPFSDGHDDGITRSNTSFSDYFSIYNRLGPLNFSNILHSFAARGRPVTCIIYTILLPWVADVASDHGIPCFLYWIQASTVFSVYQHFLHGYETLISTHAHDPLFTLPFPNLKPSIQIRDLPSFCIMSPDHPFYPIFETLKEVFEKLESQIKESGGSNYKPKVLVNSFAELEPDVDVDEVELVPVGPVLPFLFEDQLQEEDDGSNLFKADDKGYMQWLDSKEEGSVVYISFGSFWEFKKEDMDEILKGLKESKRPYLWVVRKDNREKELLEIEGEEGDDQDGNGMMVEWCSQVRVLAHKAVGCFVTHCGWNSTLESLSCGVPMVSVPQWTDQGMNAKSEVDGNGVVKGEELVRCLELVMGDGEKGVEIRTKAKMWKDEALEAVSEGGSSDVNLKAFVDGIKKLIK
ncbi:Crocetin glucosyltransferase protein [Dioscorea alata]|uniref:Crocetin glucosyltransferase protein n=1 Tax=Dioscorea alata TaxID=55571 RepID=A0ACB7UAH2_DIOAL|nr:Crocetin glucosyltransferase protein [Dioscorea alata]